MALIKCPECGNQISEFATACIHCGCPMSKIKELLLKRAAPQRKPEPVINKTEAGSFLESRSLEEQRIIKYFVEELSKRFDPLFKANSRYMYTIGKGTYIRHETYCWFTRSDRGSLLFKYYSKDKKNTYAQEINTENKEYCLRKLLFELTGQEPIRSVETVEDIEDRDDEFENVYPYRLIVRYFADEYVHIDDETLSLLKEVREYFRKKYHTETRFDFLTNTPYTVWVFLGRSMNSKNLSIKNAKYIYDHFYFDSIINLLKQYEKAFNKLIVTDYRHFESELEDMIAKNNVSLSSSRYILSTLSLIPQSTLYGLLEKLERFANLKAQ